MHASMYSNWYTHVSIRFGFAAYTGTSERQTFIFRQQDVVMEEPCHYRLRKTVPRNWPEPPFLQRFAPFQIKSKQYNSNKDIFFYKLSTFYQQTVFKKDILPTFETI
jgi:hypothetical protein